MLTAVQPSNLFLTRRACPRPSLFRSSQAWTDLNVWLDSDTGELWCQGKWSGRIWLDIEDTASHSYWGSDTSANRQWATELLVAAVNAVGHDKVGIYASRYMWSLVSRGARARGRDTGAAAV